MKKIDEKLTPHPDHPMGIDLDLSDVTWSERLYSVFQRLELAAPETFHVEWFSLAMSPPNRKKNVVIFPKAKNDSSQPWHESGIVERAVREAIRYRGWAHSIVQQVSGKPGARMKPVHVILNQNAVEIGNGPSVIHAFLKACNK